MHSKSVSLISMDYACMYIISTTADSFIQSMNQYSDTNNKLMHFNQLQNISFQLLALVFLVLIL